MMKLLFKDPVVPVDGVAEVGNTVFKDYYPNVNKSTAWPMLKPYIDQATRTYVIPFLGRPFYDVIANYVYTPPGTLDPKMDELIHLLRTAIAYYTIHKALPHIITVISDMGARSNQNPNSSPIDAFTYKNTLWAAIMGADSALDQSLAYLLQEKTHTGFSAYASKMDFWFDTVADMKLYLNINGLRAYFAMVPYINRSADTAKALLCEIYTDIKGKKTAATLTTIEKEFVDLLKKYMADTALLYAIPRLSLIIEDDGLKLVSSTDNFYTKSNAIATFGASGPTAVINKLNLDEKSARKELFAYMMKHIDDFPIYKAANEATTILARPYISPDCIGGIAL